ncbi:helix-turn-helix domain-containing protein [Mesorhizobium sp. M0676]
MPEGDDLRVEAVANEVGYEDASFFGSLFRRKTGLTPAQYRIRFSSRASAEPQLNLNCRGAMPMFRSAPLFGHSWQLGRYKSGHFSRQLGGVSLLQ